MRPLTLILLFLLALPCWVAGQVVGKQFPAMEAETIEDAKVMLPADVAGKYTLLGLAYSKKSEDELNSWFQPVFEKFIQKNKGLFEAFGYDVHVYFVPMFTGVSAAAAEAPEKKALNAIDRNSERYILLYGGELKRYKAELDLEKKVSPYFCVLDDGGKILYATSAKYSSEQ